MTPRGIVYLVGAGPGDPELITVRGLRLLQRCDVVIHDRLVSAELLSEVRPGAEVIDAGKRPGQQSARQLKINRCMVDRARRGSLVVRLKGGDPFVFGRGSEEIDVCQQAGIRCVVVPGVSSAVAGPAAAGIPVTQRNVGRSFAVVTAHTTDSADGHSVDFKALAAMDTVVVMMGRANLHQIAAGLIEAGRSPSTPAACIERATTPQQRVVIDVLGTIAAAADREKLRPPMITIIGDTVRCGMSLPHHPSPCSPTARQQLQRLLKDHDGWPLPTGLTDSRGKGR